MFDFKKYLLRLQEEQVQQEQELTHLNLSGLGITNEDLSIIAAYINNHPHITSLDLSANELCTDFTAFAGNNTLKVLNLSHNVICSFNYFDFEGLKILDLSINPLNVGFRQQPWKQPRKDVAAFINKYLCGVKALKVFRLRNCYLNNASIFRDIEVDELDLGNNDITDISPLLNTKIKKIILDRNPIANLECLTLNKACTEFVVDYKNQRQHTFVQDIFKRNKLLHLYKKTQQEHEFIEHLIALAQVIIAPESSDQPAGLKSLPLELMSHIFTLLAAAEGIKKSSKCILFTWDLILNNLAHRKERQAAQEKFWQTSITYLDQQKNKPITVQVFRAWDMRRRAEEIAVRIPKETGLAKLCN